jgi:hypothetical protein
MHHAGFVVLVMAALASCGHSRPPQTTGTSADGHTTAIANRADTSDVRPLTFENASALEEAPPIATESAGSERQDDGGVREEPLPAHDDAPTEVEPQPRAEAARDNAMGSAGAPPTSAADACEDEVDASALPRAFDQCSAQLVDLDGKPPCEIACELVDQGPEPLFRTRVHTVYFTATRRPAKEIGRVLTYDGPLDATSSRSAADHSRSVFINRTTSPPTIEVRAASCLFDCGSNTGRPSPTVAPYDPECRAACPPLARYRYQRGRLQRVR